LKTIAVVYGTRPEAIKLAPLIVELRKLNNIRTVVVCSGQHKEMLVGILELWSLAPDVTLESNFKSSRSSAIPGLMVLLEDEFLRIKPDLVLVQGDTATAAAAALQAHALHIPIGHVEAGLRSEDLWNPWPEESNRRLIDSTSSLHFAPTQESFDNLVREGNSDSTYLTGNTIVDALQFATKLLDQDRSIRSNLENLLNFNLDDPYILFTQHRREGFGEGQNNVFEAIAQLANQGHKVIFPVHLNPAVRAKVTEKLDRNQNVLLVEPQSYLPFLQLVKNSSLIISDSGGLQEEAPSFNKFILITRLRTERPEVVEAGFGHIVGFDSETISRKATELLGKSPTNLENPFGDGQAASKISILAHDFLKGSRVTI
jgi:UDP-N-acetylglucosamine 2-epimerase (non-hydrolysing)